MRQIVGYHGFLHHAHHHQPKAAVDFGFGHVGGALKLWHEVFGSHHWPCHHAWEEREIEQILEITLHRRHLALIHIHHITDGAEGVERYAYRGNNRQRVEIATHYLVPRQHEEVGVFKHHQYAHRAQQRCAQHQLARPLRFGSGDAECQMPVDNRGGHHQQEYPPTRLEGEK